MFPQLLFTYIDKSIILAGYTSMMIMFLSDAIVIFFISKFWYDGFVLPLCETNVGYKQSSPSHFEMEALTTKKTTLFVKASSYFQLCTCLATIFGWAVNENEVAKIPTKQ